MVAEGGGRKIKVLVAFKESALKQYEARAGSLGLANVSTLLEQRDISVRNLQEADARHYSTLDVVVKEIERRGWEAEVSFRGDITHVQGYDLVITVGGDGTVLDLSHRMEDNTPLLGVNSDPHRSVGYFCGATASNIAERLSAFDARTLPRYLLNRIRLTVAGETVTTPVLNDILIADVNPAATCHYVIEVAGYQESQRSSGVWVSTPAGSTAAIRSAGGLVLPLQSDLLQYLVREPYPPITGRYQLLAGVLHAEDGLSFISKMTDARVFVDGPHAIYRLKLGDRVEIKGCDVPLHLLGIDVSRRVY